MIFGIGVLFFLANNRQTHYGRYHGQARQAFAFKQYAWALKCYLKAENLTKVEVDPQLLFEKAFSLDRVGRSKEAESLMQQVAEESDFIPARLWVMRMNIAQQKLQPDDWKKMETELDKIFEDQPHNVEAHRLMVATKMQLHGKESAVPYMQKLASISPRDRLLLAKLYDEIKQPEKMALEVQRIREDVQFALDKNPKEFATRMVGVEACVLQKDYVKALQLLQNGIHRVGADAQLIRACSMVFLAWAEDISHRPNAPLDAVLEKLLAGSKFQPADPRLYHRLAAFASYQENDGQKAKQALVAALARGDSPPTVHLLLGIYATEQGNSAQGQQHWQLALSLAPNAPVIMNNLAWGLIWQKEPKLTTAFALMNTALSKPDTTGRLHETRGRILYQMGKKQEALADLELALGKLPEDWRLHAFLSQVYGDLGKAEKSLHHRDQAQKLVDELKKAAEEGQPPPVDESPAAPPDETETKPRAA